MDKIKLRIFKANNQGKTKLDRTIVGWCIPDVGDKIIVDDEQYRVCRREIHFETNKPQVDLYCSKLQKQFHNLEFPPNSRTHTSMYDDLKRVTGFGKFAIATLWTDFGVATVQEAYEKIESIKASTKHKRLANALINHFEKATRNYERIMQKKLNGGVLADYERREIDEYLRIFGVNKKKY